MTVVKDSDMDESNGSRSTKESSRSSNSHSSYRNQQIATAANYLAQQQVASNTAANANIRYQEQSPGKFGSHSSSPRQGAQPPCKNCKSTKHTTKWCTSNKCYEPNSGKTFKDAAERKAHYVHEHGFYKTDDKQPPAGRKSSMKKGQSKPGVKFTKVNRVQSEDGGEEDNDSCIDSEVSSDSSMSVDRPPKSLVWKDRPKSGKVSKIRTVSTIHRTTRLEASTFEVLELVDEILRVVFIAYVWYWFVVNGVGSLTTCVRAKVEEIGLILTPWLGAHLGVAVLLSITPGDLSSLVGSGSCELLLDSLIFRSKKPELRRKKSVQKIFIRRNWNAKMRSMRTT